MTRCEAGNCCPVANASAPQQCPAGSYQGQVGATACLPCATATTAGATACAARRLLREGADPAADVKDSKVVMDSAVYAGGSFAILLLVGFVALRLSQANMEDE